MSNTDLLKEVEDTKSSFFLFTVATDVQYGLFVGSKDCFFHHTAARLPSCNTLPAGQEHGIFYRKKIVKYSAFSSPFSL